MAFSMYPLYSVLLSSISGETKRTWFRFCAVFCGLIGRGLKIDVKSDMSLIAPRS